MDTTLRRPGCKSCHSPLIVADSLLPFTFLASTDTRNRPCFACQVVSISCAVRCIKTTPRWITPFTICQSFVLICEASEIFSLFPCCLSAVTDHSTWMRPLPTGKYSSPGTSSTRCILVFFIAYKCTLNTIYLSDAISPLSNHHILEWELQYIVGSKKWEWNRSCQSWTWCFLEFSWLNIHYSLDSTLGLKKKKVLSSQFHNRPQKVH